MGCTGDGTKGEEGAEPSPDDVVMVDVVVVVGGECVWFWGLVLVCEGFSDNVDLLEGKQNGLVNRFRSFFVG